VLSALLEQMNILARRHHVAELDHGALPIDRAANLPVIPIGFEQTEWGTFLIDLSQSSDVCWRRLKGGSARSSVRRAMRLGVRVIDATDAVAPLARCELAHSAAHRLAAWPEVFWSTLHDVLGPQSYRVLAAEYDGRLVAFVPFLVFGRTMHLLKPVQDPQCKAERVPAGDLLMWEAIRLGQRLGLSRFDLSGVSPVPSSEAERGIRFFKSKWGGDYVSYPILRRRYRRWLM
jgi:CelD/BcsL family acetyltransferase involved in cellulose biosynthesis